MEFVEEKKPIVKQSSYCRSLEDLQATALSINYNGSFLLLAGKFGVNFFPSFSGFVLEILKC